MWNVSQSLFQWTFLCNQDNALEDMAIMESQSLFQWTFLCNNAITQPMSQEYWSQSLFQWTFLCNNHYPMKVTAKKSVAILILVDFPLQRKNVQYQGLLLKSQSLFQWTFLCNQENWEWNKIMEMPSQSLFQWTFLCNRGLNSNMEDFK